MGMCLAWKLINYKSVAPTSKVWTHCNSANCLMAENSKLSNLLDYRETLFAEMVKFR